MRKQTNLEMKEKKKKEKKESKAFYTFNLNEKPSTQNASCCCSSTTPPATAGAGDLVQSVLEVTMTHSDNSTCYKSVGSLYFYLPPPRIWVSSESPLPVPMMDNFQGVVSMLMTVPHVLGPSVIEVSAAIGQ